MGTAGACTLDFERLHHVQLDITACAEDLCREFRAGALGMTERAKPPVPAARGGCRFRGRGVETRLGVVADFTPAGKAHPGILVSGLAALAARLEAHGHRVVRDADFPGHRRFHTRDALGYRPEFLAPAPVPAPVPAPGRFARSGQFPEPEPAG